MKGRYVTGSYIKVPNLASQLHLENRRIKASLSRMKFVLLFVCSVSIILVANLIFNGYALRMKNSSLNEYKEDLFFGMRE